MSHADDDEGLYCDLDQVYSSSQTSDKASSTTTTTTIHPYPDPYGSASSHAIRQTTQIYPDDCALKQIDNDQTNETGMTNASYEKLLQLQSENEILKRNIGTLYRTAKLELERKDKRIAMLEEELDHLRMQLQK